MEGVVEAESTSVEPRTPTLPKNADFSGKKVLVVDDDMRNIFAITVILERRGMEVIYADNGKTGIDKLKENPDVDVVLMDIMMPEMGGIEATQEIRKMTEFVDLPIITLTA
jgi:CheY-like chemotaxis protein